MVEGVYDSKQFGKSSIKKCMPSNYNNFVKIEFNSKKICYGETATPSIWDYNQTFKPLFHMQEATSAS
jgi:hypothetical protein